MSTAVSAIALTKPSDWISLPVSFNIYIRFGYNIKTHLYFLMEDYIAEPIQYTAIF